MVGLDDLAELIIAAIITEAIDDFAATAVVATEGTAEAEAAANTEAAVVGAQATTTEAGADTTQAAVIVDSDVTEAAEGSFTSSHVSADNLNDSEADSLAAERINVWRMEDVGDLQPMLDTEDGSINSVDNLLGEANNINFIDDLWARWDAADEADRARTAAEDARALTLRRMKHVLSLFKGVGVLLVGAQSISSIN
jgi:hypothetical protein